MTAKEVRKLETILGKVEALQNETADLNARERLQEAKSALLRLYAPQLTLNTHHREGE